MKQTLLVLTMLLALVAGVVGCATARATTRPVPATKSPTPVEAVVAPAAGMTEILIVANFGHVSRMTHDVAGYKAAITRMACRNVAVGRTVRIALVRGPRPQDVSEVVVPAESLVNCTKFVDVWLRDYTIGTNPVRWENLMDLLQEQQIAFEDGPIFYLAEEEVTLGLPIREPPTKVVYIQLGPEDLDADDVCSQLARAGWGTCLIEK